MSRNLSLILSLQGSEKSAFLDFLASPYFNRQKKLERLGHFLLNAPEDEATDFRLMFELLFGKQAAFRKQAVYDALSQLTRLLERFWALRAFEADPPGQQRYLLQTLAGEQASSHFERQWTKALAYWEDHPHRDLYYYEGEYKLHRDASIFAAGRQRRDEDAHLQHTIYFLDLYYWTARLKYSCELLNRSNILNQGSADEWLQPLENWLGHLPQSYRRQPAIRAYLLIFRALQQPEDESHFRRWIDWLEANSERFSTPEAADMYNYAQNYCIHRINQGDTRYLKELFTLFEQLVTKDLVLDQGNMDHWKLKNMVTVGIRLQAYAWVDDFLNRYRDKLLPVYQQDAYLFNLASLRYAQGHTSEALTLLQRVEFQDVFYHLSAKSLLLKIYFETDEDAALEFLLETFRLYIRRNRAISTFQRKIHLNLLRLTRKLYRLRAQQGIISREAFARRLAKLKERIRQEEEVANRSWLQEQAEKLGE